MYRRGSPHVRVTNAWHDEEAALLRRLAADAGDERYVDRIDVLLWARAAPERLRAEEGGR
jgi:hypothetical protein